MSLLTNLTSHADLLRNVEVVLCTAKMALAPMIGEQTTYQRMKEITDPV
jgi:hypothetical protein